MPFNVKRDERVRYIEALENADKENPQLLVDFFADTQKNIIEKAFQINTADPLISSSFLDVVSAFSAKLTSKHQHEEESRSKSLANNRQIIFDHCDSLLNVVKDKMETMLNNQKIKKQVHLYIEKYFYEDEKAYYFGRDIIALAKKHGYYFNRSLPRAWFKFGLQSKEKEYKLIITLHHYGYGGSTIAIGAFFQDQSEKNEGDSTYLPLSLTKTKEDKPLTISIDSSEDKITLHCEERIPDYLERILSLMMIQIMGELG